MLPLPWKLFGQDRLDAVDLDGDVRRRKPDDFGDRRRVHFFEVTQHDLAFERLEPADEFREAFECPLAVEVDRMIGGRLDGIQTLQEAGVAVLAMDVRSGDIMRNPEDPGAKRAAPVVGGEAAPEMKVDLLTQVATAVGVGLIAECQAIDRGSALAKSLFEEFGLPVHNCIVAPGGTF